MIFLFCNYNLQKNNNVSQGTQNVVYYIYLCSSIIIFFRSKTCATFVYIKLNYLSCIDYSYYRGAFGNPIKYNYRHSNGQKLYKYPWHAYTTTKLYTTCSCWTLHIYIASKNTCRYRDMFRLFSSLYFTLTCTWIPPNI